MYRDAEQTIAALRQETEQFYRKVDASRRIDESFSCADDEPLTEGEIAEINEYWGKYSFAYPNIDYKSFQTFKNRSGRFDVRHCPGAIRTSYLAKHFVDRQFSRPFQHKVMLPFLYPDIRQPELVGARMDGILYDGNYNPVTLEQLVDICRSQDCGLIIKPVGSSGGKGITVLHQKDIKKFSGKNLGGGGALVIQKLVKQSPFMEALNASSVNTIRITTLLFKKKVRPLAALIRIGNAGSQVDNWCSGGSLLGIDLESGKCLNWAMANDRRHITKFPSGVDLSETVLTVPNFDEVKSAVCRCHYRIPYIKMISWDIALDQENCPVLIENNFGGMIQLHEATTGPLFGPLMDELCDEYLLKQFYTRFATQDFICKEYHDHIAVSEYIGASETVAVPETLNGKPVTYMEPNAFKNCVIKVFSAPIAAMRNSPAALKSIQG